VLRFSAAFVEVLGSSRRRKSALHGVSVWRLPAEKAVKIVATGPEKAARVWRLANPSFKNEDCFMRHNIRAWGRAFLSGDRKSLWVQGLLDNGGTIDLEIPFPLASQLVEGFALAGQQASIEAAEDNDAKPDFSGETWDAIPARGLAFALGKDAAETLLVADLFRVRLAFALDSKKVAEAGVSFARLAAMLSADPSRNV